MASPRSVMTELGRLTRLAGEDSAGLGPFLHQHTREIAGELEIGATIGRDTDEGIDRVSVRVDTDGLTLTPVDARDVAKRGYTEKKVLEEMDRRAPDIAKYVAPQAKYADLTVAFYRPTAANVDPAKLSARIRKGGRFRALDYAEFQSESTSIRQTEQTTAGGFPETIIDLDGTIEPGRAEQVEDRLWFHIGGTHARPTLGEYQDAQGRNQTGYALALAQLLIARRVVLIESERMEMAE